MFDRYAAGAIVQQDELRRPMGGNSLTLLLQMTGGLQIIFFYPDESRLLVVAA